ncbi:hypothetical protein LTR62_005440 [Meristemomyces frigidus]|uniref:Uncharacterized protein n=1 Tax=Meristemomyces frigidus TaxID=1508187 RepID=A0AAN7TGV2_9PEZI|nr:hypothetical protein LTR62_005440 [Meristemomyces frigidus]
MLRRYQTYLIFAVLSVVFLFTIFQNVAWRRLPQVVGLGEHYDGASEEEKMHDVPDVKPGHKHEDLPSLQEDKSTFKEPKVESDSPYPIGELKPAGSNYTKCLVVSRQRSEDSTWIQDELRDMLDDGILTKAEYVVDDHSAPLHPIKNKGHESNVYLTYIIDHYDQLSDLTIFIHFHRFSWHNNILMDEDAAQMVRHLSPERVTRDGYMNLRCHWEPGCPSWLHPGATQRNYDKMEETLVADAWAELFPLDPIPAVLAQPCCAQFAVSRDRIRALPKQRYVSMRDWILRTELSDYMSGRVFEYIWQYIFTASPIHCPSMSACYCDGYGYCFGSPQAFDKWFELRYEVKEYAAELALWREQADLIERARNGDGTFDEEAVLDVPQIGRDAWLRAEMEDLEATMLELKHEAFERGRKPELRALEVGRMWKDGDGF